MEKYLVVNVGSSSLKFSLYEVSTQQELANGYIQKIGLDDSFYTFKHNGKKSENQVLVKNHMDATNLMIKVLLENKIIDSVEEINGVGHRVLHGGEIYSKSTLIDDEVLENIKKFIKLGPLHQGPQITGIESMKKVLPNVPMVAVFDTAFHQTMPEENYIYPAPYEWYENHDVRKYGFHGTSYNYITNQMGKILGKENPNLIVCHIGSGASIDAIKDGKSINTSMGLTPLDGIMMATRSGSIDPSIPDYIAKETGKSISEINDILNKQSGLFGICGKSDTRDIEAMINNGDKKALLALKLYTNAIIKYIAQYYFELEGNIDALVFTAGVGENSARIRKMVVDKLSKVKILNIKLDEEMNNKIAGFKDINTGIITTKDSSFPIYVVPTNEELMILNDTYKLVKEKENVKNLQKKLI